MRFFLTIFSILFISCSPEKSEMNTDLKSVIKNFSKEICIDESCATVNFTWPEFEKSEIGDRLNQAIQEQLQAYFYLDSVGRTTLEEQADSYLESFRETKTDFPDMPGGWAIEVEAAISFDSLNTLTVFFTEYNYSGGAHPNSSNYFMNFDRSTGEFLSIDRLILNQDKMKEIAEMAFREFHEVDPEKSLEADGRFFLPETGFFLPNAMGFKDGKFHLIYIPYEIGSYAMGYTELEFSLEELQGVVRM
ncbi:PdaC/SigV domain-containing protein [Algoriphagus marinus]|uniref:PdaC/SigV domain-containing protein n=1 Tax=Algoriphagus marinus TaxID=1925762 RepID=UPI00094B7F52|nr:DUF4163 domain-containing protein [Algoriphagus marinus]